MPNLRLGRATRTYPEPADIVPLDYRATAMRIREFVAETIEAAGVKPLQEEFDHLAGLRKREEVLPALARLHLRADKQGARAWLEPCAYVEELREAEGIAYT